MKNSCHVWTRLVLHLLLLLVSWSKFDKSGLFYMLYCGTYSKEPVKLAPSYHHSDCLQDFPSPVLDDNDIIHLSFPDTVKPT